MIADLSARTPPPPADTGLALLGEDAARDRVWPSKAGSWLGRARGARLTPRSAWGLLGAGSSLPRPARRLLADGRARRFRDGVGNEQTVAWRMQEDPVLAGLDDCLDPRSVGLGSRELERGVVAGYKPLRRAVVRFEDSGGPAYFVKHVRPRRAEAMAQRHELLAGWARVVGEFSLPALARLHRAPDYLVWRAAPGRDLERSLLDQGPVALEPAGRCVAALHACPVRLPQLRRPSSELAATAAWIEATAPLHPEPRALRKTLTELEALARRLPAARPVLTHGDLHDGQFLLAQDRTYLLDLDTVCMADPELDLGNLLAHLDLLGLRHPALAHLDLDRRLLGAYGGRRGRSIEPARLAWHRALASLRLACVHAPRPTTHDLAPRLADRARLLTRALRKRRQEDPVS